MLVFSKHLSNVEEESCILAMVYVAVEAITECEQTNGQQMSLSAFVAGLANSGDLEPYFNIQTVSML